MIRSLAANAFRFAARRNTSPLMAASLRTGCSVRTVAALAGGGHVDAMVLENPNLDVVRYEHKNIVWTTRHVQYYSEALAIGFLEMGFTAGDVVLSWMPEHFSEQMVLQFACSKSGMILYTLDHLIATQDSTKATEALTAALQVTKANILITPEATNDVNYIHLVHQVIPELRIFDTSTGAPFVTPRFPDLRVAVHTGFDQEDKYGWFPLRHMVVPSQNLDSFVLQAPGGDTPLAGVLKMENDIPVGVGPVLTNEQVLEKNLWPTYCSILQKQFHTVEGVGVVF